jgi:hypothetical protein
LSTSPDAAIFARLLARDVAPPGEDPTELVLRLTSAVQEVTALLRAASAQLGQGRTEWRAEELAHLANLLSEAERAAHIQAACTAVLLRQVTRPAVA